MDFMPSSTEKFSIYSVGFLSHVFYVPSQVM